MRLGLALLSLTLTVASAKKADMQPQTAGDYLNAAGLAMDADEYSAAESIAREGQARFPHAVGFHLIIGDALFSRGKKADAFYEYQWETMRTGPDRTSGQEAQQKAAEILDGRGTDVDELRMVVSALQGMEADPAKSAKTLTPIATRRDAFVLKVLLAESLVAASQTKEAIAVYRELIRRDPFFVPAYVELGELLEKSGKADEGKSLLAKAKEIDPDHWRLKSLGTP